MILSSRPEDRRAVFEEAAGITKYKTQKREALRKLEATEANLLRISDMIKEVKRQIGSLQRQAGKARRYQALHADLRVLDTHHSRKATRLRSEAIWPTAARRSRSSPNRNNRRGPKSTSAKMRSASNGWRWTKSTCRWPKRAPRCNVCGAKSATHPSRIEFNRQRAQELKELIERARR